MTTKVHPAAVNDGADRPVCVLGGCACNSSGLCGVRGPTSSMVCGMFPRSLCHLVACVINLFLAPPFLVINWVRVYLAPCVLATIHLGLARLCCNILSFNRCCPKYRDPAFPANDESIGYNIIEDGATLPCCDLVCCCCARIACFCRDPCGTQHVKWKRASELFPKTKGRRPKLFDGKIEAADVKQGRLGDCWLLAAIAACAEHHPDLIRRLFLTKFQEECGCYRIRLYDTRRNRWTTQVIDDRIPLDDTGSRPRFTQPHDNELWVLLLEKAFARMWSSYGYLKGNDGSLALQSFTGNHAVNIATADFVRRNGIDKFFAVLRGALHLDVTRLKKPAIIAGASCVSSQHGLVANHAYSLLDAATLESGRVKLVQLRNPWGNTSWTGAYSNAEPSWMEHAGLSVLGCDIKPEPGKFWMKVDDFVHNFSRVYFVGTSISIATTTMNYHESAGLCGPALGCAKGSVAYWCGCRGLRTMCFPERRTTLQMLIDAGLDPSSKGWYTQRYTDQNTGAGRHNKASWAESVVLESPKSAK
ncbi:hypothetical protein CTAYLR_008005 [Chrysophaeum taylorii]|uniref:Calpain catalytic domain-containing protein n=1 Tax=Chrysophaeum taylorii TaxID=2483200 RepID=A0AAD7U6X4_9STRA|nr:hypothetical protein CTAYLR_008005 [Chrysophaeum taylorii]